ncbi:ORF MSV087 putative thioredoxin, similar to Neurospora crassa GB:D45892 [Melanoplus sanguinipes entomopoxvirus]|uniref:ORF MSV087 putative thioredoxin, similar to Neurospora crassa GB:D45892 n=1 Tax=Melanoplus sanguinipes entomopoxvirus TaxID=83191 RepID=Q9YW05_MSEPV|nr:ORF MSV087 putative thioredoxin, similar to Neurospora crassa GB:D45892 [Melanoplus sanguinipes entomopoxvirus]AAC97638.1 ORF MSV087 putative thioredoxin, similar to Neurospora crassa GB:D45892 [Melanoplus sanguinipes entomopoxvirus 'O']
MDDNSITKNIRTYYIPDICMNCKKLNPEKVLVTDGKFKTNFLSFDQFNKNDTTFLEYASGGSSIPIKLFFNNGHYR